jgi:murein DD-endopeptidase MepM/ murein hydrolase activator NlpD
MSRALAFALLALCACATPGPERERTFCANAIRISHAQEQDRVRIDVANQCHVALTVELDFAKLENLRALDDLPVRRALPPRSITRLAEAAIVEPGVGWSYRPRLVLLFWGAVRPEPDPTFRYAFPFGGGVPRPLVQGVGGAFTHQGVHRYAFDFDLPRGTDVLAARAGTVLVVFDGEGDGAPEPGYENRGNAVFVLHDDGTIAGYSHLTRGISVREGTRVAAGERLGASGSSGYSRGPHLHFEVSTQREGPALESIPIRFRGDVEPVVGRSYGPYPGAATEATR